MSLSRREWLTYLLGAPLALQACRRPEPARVAGSIRGGSMVVGHRLRGEPPNADGAPVVDVEVVIVGGGPSGLSAAWRLSRLGEPRFVLLELESQAGGTSTYGTDGVVPYPWGAHYLPLPSADNAPLLGLLRELRTIDDDGQPAEAQLVREAEERLFLEGRWREGLYPAFGASDEDIRELRRFESLVSGFVRFRDGKGRRAFTIPVSACSDDAEIVALDRISAETWFKEHGFRSERLRWYLEYATRDDYGLRLRDTSAWALLFYFAARATAEGGDSAPFLSWPEGNGRLVQHLATVLGERVRLGQLVTEVVPDADGVMISALDVASQRLVRYRARQAILAVPQFVAARIYRPWRARPPDHLAAFSYGPWMVANLHLSARPRSRGFPLAWDNVLYDSPSLGYVAATHQALLDHGPTIWTYYHPLSDLSPEQARKDLASLDHQQGFDAILSDLSRAHIGLGEHIARVDIWRHGHAMIRPVPGFIWSAARRAAARPDDARVFFAHCDLSGIALFEEAFDQGLRAADGVMNQRRGRG